MQATTARGTDAERTEEAAPVAVENVLVDAEARAVVADVVGLEVTCEDAELVTFALERGAETLVTGATESDEVGRTDGRVGAVPVSELGITVGNVSVGPASLHKKSSEKPAGIRAEVLTRLRVEKGRVKTLLEDPAALLGQRRRRRGA
jgi:hypothetical protein